MFEYGLLKLPGGASKMYSLLPQCVTLHKLKSKPTFPLAQLKSHRYKPYGFLVGPPLKHVLISSKPMFYDE